MKKIILISLLLVSFSIAEETNNLYQKYGIKPPENLQNIGRGYAKDPLTNQIYYEGKSLSNSYHIVVGTIDVDADYVRISFPESFRVLPLNSDSQFDAEDYLTDYMKGDRTSRVACNPGLFCFSTKLNIPIECIPVKDDPIELLTCYQKKITTEFWSTIPPINPKDFKPLAVKEILHDPSKNRHASLLVYFRDKSNVYLSEHESTKIIEGADPETFETLFYPFAKDKNNFYWHEHSNEFKWFGKNISMLNPATTTYMGSSEGGYISTYVGGVTSRHEAIRYNNYVMSDNKIYYQGQNVAFEEIKGADAETFKIIDYPYAKDKTSVYYHGKAIPNFSSQGFIIDNTGLSLAHNESFVAIQDHVFEKLSVNNFEVIYYGNGSNYRTHVILKDEKNIYHINYDEIDLYDKRALNIISLSLDPGSIEFVSTPWKTSKTLALKDKNGVYFLIKETESLEHDSIEFISTPWSIPKTLIRKDKNGIYFLTKETENHVPIVMQFLDVDPESFIIMDEYFYTQDFIVIDEYDAYKNESTRILAKDNNGEYFLDELKAKAVKQEVPPKVNSQS